MKQIALLFIVVLAAWSIQAADKFEDISTADLKKAIASNSVTLLDCNGSKSYANAHIPGALDFSAVKESLVDKLPKDKTALIVAYCGGPKCGAYKRGASAAQALGYTNVKHYSGGLSGWKGSGEKAGCSKAASCSKGAVGAATSVIKKKCCGGCSKK